MTGFNLPPGVTADMIPGNRPEDGFADVLYERMAEATQTVCDALPGLTLEDLTWVLREIADDVEGHNIEFIYRPNPSPEVPDPEDTDEEVPV